MEADPHPFGDEWPEGWPNGQARLSSQPVLWRQDTATFVLFPISLGIVSLAVALFGFGLVKRRGAYQAVSTSVIPLSRSCPCSKSWYAGLRSRLGGRNGHDLDRVVLHPRITVNHGRAVGLLPDG